MKVVLFIFATIPVLVASQTPLPAGVPPPQPGGKVGDAGKIAAMSPMRPPVDCDSDNENPKYYNEKCANDDECYGNADAMSCVKGVCTCTANFVPEERFLGEASNQKVCVPAPYLFAPCDTICQKPFVCKTVEGSTAKACQCDTSYTLKDGSCTLDCKDDESYDQTSYKCIRKCKANEVKINSTCKPQESVGSACESNHQCVSAYSECKDNKCTCRPGFDAKDGSCISQTASCPTGDALKGNAGGYRLCLISDSGVKTDDKKPPPPPAPIAASAAGPNAKSFVGGYQNLDLKDNCPDTHFCVVTGGKFYAAGSDGICCPKIKTSCPFGNAHSKANCQGFGDNYCPWETHYCYGVIVGNSGSKELCCPKECPQNTIAVNGKCLPEAIVGDACIAEGQCTDPSADCVNGFCKCVNGSTQAGTAYKFCTRDCKDTEVLNNNVCYSRLSLGDSCEGQDWRCPFNAYCNNKKVCACLCGMFTLSKDMCAPAPSCPRPSFGPVPLFAGADGAAPKAAPAITEEKKKELLKNVTFCNVKGSKAPSDVKAVDTCAKTQYCAAYLPAVGICCTTPEALCPDGKKPVSDKPCDPANPLSCGPNNNCYQYLVPAGSDNNVGRICCKAFTFNPLPPN